ncbi:alpha/beta fold hydrolase [Actinokineospora sp.]|uniref:alpha/beta fold hydrolase n=1 Tax=Actinokineospora sp. TaxID=1872133 RepID=UPI003D6ACB94
MWYEERGVGDPVVLLHPGGVDARAWGPNLDAFAARFRVFTPDRRGHGRTLDVAGPITYELMAQDTVAFLEDVVGAPAHLVGCSDGAIVALHTALRRPDLVDRVALVAGVFNREGWVPGAADLDEETSAYFAAAYGEVSPDGPDHYPIVADKLARMHAHEPTLTAADLAGVPNRALVMVGDDDQVILEHAIAYYRGLPNAELAVIPGTSHGLLVEKTTLCNTIIIDFLANEPVPTLAPIRRARSGI